MKQILIYGVGVVIVGVGFWWLFGQPSSDQEVQEQEEVMVSEEQVQVAEETVPYFANTTGYLALPRGEGPHPALILIHEWWGLNDDIKSIARRFAEQGYVALAVDMYNGQVTTESAEARVLSSAVRDDVDGAFENLQAAIDYLRARPEVDAEKLASVGWCFGGGWSYQMALNDLDINASVMYYGQFNPDDDFDMMRADIIGHFGETDASIAVDNVREFQAELATTNGMHEVYIYPNVGHGFANLRGGDNLAYSQEAADLAWIRTQDFLSKVFGK
jgi:carboxymethylenebutenolidase